ILEIKGRNLVIDNFFNGIAKFTFEELCNRNLGSEDYIKVANNCSFIFIEKLPDFNYTNSNQQQRFITLIDILYEKKIPIMITSEKHLDKIGSSIDISSTFKRTISRLHELTSLSFQSK
ncbi:MAG: cell division protein ZapE, partial [Proteobacteria bacterium]|nr:cell division protein ZapE [Pseudomonadota bacterium]